MSRVRVGAVLPAIVLAVTSCDEDPKTQEPVSPLAPPAPVVSPLTALIEAPVKVKGSTVCVAYERERSKLIAQLKEKPEDKDLLKRASAVAAVIIDACN